MSDCDHSFSQPLCPDGIMVSKRGAVRGKKFDRLPRIWLAPPKIKLATFSASSKSKPKSVPVVAADAPDTKLPPMRLITSSVSLPSARDGKLSTASTRGAQL